MCIYSDIVQAYFIGNMKVETMEKIYRVELLEYRHHTHDRILTFTKPLDAIIAIIQCEKTAHKQVKNFKTKTLKLH